MSGVHESEGAAVMEDATFYSCDDEPETLCHSDPDEAIEERLDCLAPDGWQKMTREERIAALPKTVTLYTYTRMKVRMQDIRTADDILADIVDPLTEEEYGDPDGRDAPDYFSKEGLPEVMAAIEALRATIHKHFVPWSCEQSNAEEIDVAKWLWENPEFLS